jgi:hypothetical protein
MRDDQLCGEVVARTLCQDCFGDEGNDWTRLEIKEREHEDKGTTRRQNDLTALWNKFSGNRAGPIIVLIECPEMWDGLCYCELRAKPRNCKKDARQRDLTVIEWGCDYLHPQKKFTSNVGEPEIVVRFLEQWPKQEIIKRGRSTFVDDPDMVKERDANLDREMNLDRNVFFAPEGGECAVPTRYVVGPSSQENLSVQGTWYKLCVAGDPSVDYLVLSEDHMNTAENFVDDNR